MFFFRIYLTFSLPQKLKNSNLEMPIILQTLAINSSITRGGKSINLHTMRKVIEYSSGMLGYLLVSFLRYVCPNVCRDYHPLSVLFRHLSLKDTSEAISNGIIANLEGLKKEHNEVVISNIVSSGCDSKEKGKALNSILIEEFSRKKICIINPSNIIPQRLLNRSKLNFNSYDRSIFVKNIRDFINNLSVSNWQRKRDNLGSIKSSPFLSDTSCLGFSNLFKQPANDLANIKNQRLSDPSTVLIGHLNVISFRNKYEIFA